MAAEAAETLIRPPTAADAAAIAAIYNAGIEGRQATFTAAASRMSVFTAVTDGSTGIGETSW